MAERIWVKRCWVISLLIVVGLFHIELRAEGDENSSGSTATFGFGKSWVPGMASGPGTLFVRAKAISIEPALGPNASEKLVPEVNLSLLLTNVFSLELDLSLMSDKYTPSGAGLSFGEQALVVPALMFQYQFSSLGSIRPYLGGGLISPAYYSANLGMQDAPFEPVNRPLLGFGIQAGLDYAVDYSWFVNFDIKQVYVRSENAEGNQVNVNPLVFGLGLGRAF